MYKPYLILILLIISSSVFAQRGIVTGVMREGDGTPLPGVSIYVKGTEQATLTDMNGSYRIECNVGDILVFSFIGFATKEKEVTFDMLTTITDPNPTEKVIQVAVNPIINRDYYVKITKSRPEFYNFADMNGSLYKWRFKHHKNCNYFYTYDIREINMNDSICEFVENLQPVYYEIEYDSYYFIKDISHLPSLQSEFAQGRPVNGVNTWSGAENNEVFAWGPPVSDLAFDGSSYPYDVNGKLVIKNGIYKVPSKSYNPYAIFQKGTEWKSTLKLKLQQKENKVEINYSRKDDKEVLNAIKNNSNAISLKSTYEKERHTVNANFGYFKDYCDFASINGLWTNLMASIMLTPPTFDNSQGFQFGNISQRSSAPMYKDNPDFLLNLGKSRKENSNGYGYVSYYVRIGQNYLGLNVNYNRDSYLDFFFMPVYSSGFPFDYGDHKEINSSNLSFTLSASNSSEYYLDINSVAIFNIENLDFTKTVYDFENINKKMERKSLDWSQTIIYRPLRYNSKLKLNLKNAIYLANNDQKWVQPSIGIAYNFGDYFHFSELDRLNLSTNYSTTVSEFPFYLKDKSYNSLLYDLNQMNSYLENQDLFFNEELELETRKSFNIKLEVVGSHVFNILYYNLNLGYYQNQVKNGIFPILNDNTFELKNAADIKTDVLDIKLELRAGRWGLFEWEGICIFSKSESKVLGLNNGLEQVPVAGFQSVSKTLIKDQPVGVILGSAYERNAERKLIIGSDGYPLVSQNKEIIGDPNPDFYSSFENKFSFKNLVHLNILIDYQKGGDIWNGTRNVLSYYGLSKETLNSRSITNYIFEGVDENGLPNTIPVDFANPANGLNGNRWYRHGTGGVAEDAIEDGTWMRIKEIALTLELFKRQRKFINSLTVKLFANNVWIKTKYSGASPLTWFNNYSQAQGLDYFNMPAIRQFGMGVSLKI